MGIHIHIHSENEETYKRSLKEITDLIIINNQKTEQVMAILDDIQADISALTSAFTSITAAVAALASGINPGGISADDAAALKESLDGEVASAQSVLASLTALAPAPAPAS